MNDDHAVYTIDQVMRQIGKMVHLQSLGTGFLNDLSSMVLRDTLPFSLGVGGLQHLASLKRLETLNVKRCAHAIRYAEARWMDANWPKLREISGLDRLWENSTTHPAQWLRSRGVDMRAEAANPISFCKCVCGDEKQITPLPQDNEPIFAGMGKACGACTKQFCLDYHPDICKGVGTGNGDELVTSCFERDSYKDQFVVYLFLMTTTGLLGVAGLKPFVKGFWQRRQQRSYTHMPM
ncbi:hypothetical protein BGW42_006456 [Actinomortierella wolfii]|nr:hypothetical protein BGW42_006456 [Actinomortierella wolfii]